MAMEFNMSALTKKLGEIEKKVANKATKNALEAGAEIMLKSQKKLVPEDTGELKDSLSKGKIKTKKGSKRIDIGTMDAPEEQKKYGYYVNFGSRGKAGTFFMEESYEQAKEESYEAIKNTLAEEIMK